MAQDFERYIQRNVGTSAATVHTSNSDDAIISVRIVDDVNQAILHINKHGSQHTDSIITEDNATADRFLSEIDSAIVMHNTSTQFADGNEFGMGAEIGISNGKLHARGPVGAEQLTTYKYRVYGTGQVRP